MTDEPCWYCVRTKPKNEKTTSFLLRSEVGIEVFCPFIRFERARRTGRTWVTEAMFPGYLFARFSFISQSRRILAIRGVTSIINFGGRPAAVHDDIVVALRAAVRDEETIVIQSDISVGEEVNLVAGPFKGLRAVVTKVLPARQRVAVLLEVLGMEREVEVSTDALLPDIPHPLVQGKT